MKKPLSLFQRQIHLDFHTSPHIPDVGADFDADEFAQTLVDAHVNSVTVFAKCHHGMCYYPTQTGTQHPALDGRDLLGEQIEALHKRGIRAPIYTTIVWEEDAAARFPQWRQFRKDGTFAGTPMATDNSGAHPGAWKWLNFLNPEYQDYFEAHLREIIARYGDAVDGLFMDILMMNQHADWSESGRKFRREHGLTSDDLGTQNAFESAAQHAFTSKFTRVLDGIAPDIGLFYNSGSHFYTDAQTGAHARLDDYTHFEVESLPSGFWGYAHFPRVARLVCNWGVEWLAMTGRFQRQWGDFGGIKPVPALEFECFRAQALGGANSVGDQLPPRGVLDPAAYKLIGEVFAQCEGAEPFYAESEMCPQIGVFTPNSVGQIENETGKSEEGAVQMAEESKYDCVVLDDVAALEGLELLVVPDSVIITATLKQKLANYYANGGNLILSHNAGFDANGDWALDFLPLKFEGDGEKYPTFWRVNPNFAPALALGERVVYAQGKNILPDGLEVLAQRVLPYFQRTDVTFSSHFQTPPQKESDKYPAIVAGERFVYFADPIFREYRQTGNTLVRDAWRAAMKKLIGAPQFGEGLPTTMTMQPRRRNDDLLLTLLHYIPVRKALDIDVIEERMPFGGYFLNAPDSVKSVREWDGAELEKTESGWALPPRYGRLLLEVPGYFAE